MRSPTAGGKIRILQLRHQAEKGRYNEMTAAQFEMLEASEAEQLLRIRFDVLSEWGCPLGNALVIASHVDVEIADAVSLLQRGCPPHLVLPILG
jgi:hypothetical protein